MVFIVRDAAQLSRPETARKLIKAGDFELIEKARDMIAEAMEKRDEIIGAAQAAFEAERRRGYQDGLEAAKREQASSMMEIVSQSVDYFSKVENRMVELVFDAVRHVVTRFDSREHVVTAVRMALDPVRNQKQLMVRVHPEQVEPLRSRLDELMAIYPAIECVDVGPDARLALDACSVESDIGIVEASLSGQIEALRETFQSVFGARG